jgi:hypothetical protein
MRNLSENKYAKRLIQEWIDHNRIIIAVDWDDCLFPWKLNTKEDCEKVFKLLRLCKEIGCYVVIFTACTEDRYIEIRNYCEQNNLKIDAINKNPIELPYGNQTKIYANHFLDDRAGLEEACEILEFAAYTILSKKHSPTIQTVEF